MQISKLKNPRVNRQPSTVNCGFTMLELVIAIGILLLITVPILGFFHSFRDKQALDSSTESVVTLLHNARNYTTSSQNDAQYGVHFGGDRVVLFKAPTFATGTAGNIELLLSSSVKLSSVQLTGGGMDVLFNRLTGASAKYGTSTISLKTDATKYRKVLIRSTGLLEITQ